MRRFARGERLNATVQSGSGLRVPFSISLLRAPARLCYQCDKRPPLLGTTTNTHSSATDANYSLCLRIFLDLTTTGRQCQQAFLCERKGARVQRSGTAALFLNLQPTGVERTILRVNVHFFAITTSNSSILAKFMLRDLDVFLCN